MNDKGKRREASRSGVHTEAELATPEGKRLAGVIKDVSIRGVFVQCGEKPAVGSVCSILFFLGGRESGQSFAAKGRVVRVSDDGAALEFLEVTDEGLHHLRNLILYNSPDPDQAQREFDERLGLRKPPEPT